MRLTKVMRQGMPIVAIALLSGVTVMGVGQGLASAAGPGGLPPIIEVGPVSQTVAPGTNVVFSVTFTSLTTATEQWFFNGTPLQGATNATLALPNVTVANAGNYDVRVTNAAGSVTSSPATLTISKLATASSLSASVSTVGFGNPVELTDNLTPSSGPTGTVAFSDSANGQTYSLGTENLSASGVATYTGTLPAVGVNAITATYSGDSQYLGSTTAPATDVVVTAPSGLVTVTQVRFSGPSGESDAYVDLENTSSTMSLPLDGWSIGLSTGPLSSNSIPLPSGVTLPPGGAYLVAGSAYSLTSVAPADLTSSVLAGVDGIFVSPPSGGGPPTDQVGYPDQGGYYGGVGLPYLSGSPTDQYAFIRQGSQTQPTDTGNNASDFVLASTDAASFPLVGGGSAQSVLGSPSPLSATSARQMDSLVPSTLAVPSAGATSCPNRVVTAGSPTTLVFNRTVTNSTGKPITGILFRITTLTQQYGPPAGSHAWLTVVGSADPTHLTCGSTPYTMDGLSLNGPTRPSGGGLGTTLSPSEVSTQDPLAPGASIVVSFKFVVTQGGSFTVGYDTDVTLAS
jgi:Bacterial Ig-like domain (group 3)/Immunoglobulin domain